MRSKEEINERLAELHGKSIRKEMGGQVAISQATLLLWVLGEDNIPYGTIISTVVPYEGSKRKQEVVDVSDYVEVEPVEEAFEL